MNLIIVESPTKARTLKKFLGREYDVEATYGHIKDLPKSKLGVGIENNFKPQYELVAKRKEVVEKLRVKSWQSKAIYLATDPDREGEAIAQHVSDVLRSNLKFKIKNLKLQRIVFHEITKEAVEEAIANPRAIDENLVDAQVARRVLDRLVGYKLSPLLWRKVRRGLSAGRVQSVVVRLIVDREREIEAFKPEEYWEISCQVKREKPACADRPACAGRSKVKSDFVVQLIKQQIKNKTRADEVVSDLEKARYQVLDVKKRQVIKNPLPPFTTSTLTQTGSRLFGWSAKKTMSFAQRLYEEGLITYHRTDSTNIALAAIDKVRSYIKKEFGDKYLPEKPRFYKTKSKLAQEAHEAIRPTNISIQGAADETDKLYRLIWKRFVACQMAASIYDETVIDVQAECSGGMETDSSQVYLLRASGQIMKFDGWQRLDQKAKIKGQENNSREVNLPEVSKGEPLQLVKVMSEQKFTEPPARYTEASLIKTLEKLGIGRPSTYAPIISTIQIRNYVEKTAGKFTPTSVGVAVNDFLLKYFPNVFDYAFTAGMEDDLDNIAKGKRNWTEVIKVFWTSFEKKLESVAKNSKRVKIETEKLGEKCPECKKGELVIRIGRFGKFISCSRFPDCKYTEKYIEKTGIKCPDCKKGEVIIKKSKHGRQFFGCSRYPDCKWASWRRPAPETSH